LSLVFEEPPTDADRHALTQRTKVEERRRDQRIEVDFEGGLRRSEPDRALTGSLRVSETSTEPSQRRSRSRLGDSP
jgi:hypothetical protein